MYNASIIEILKVFEGGIEFTLWLCSSMEQWNMSTLAPGGSDHVQGRIQGVQSNLPGFRRFFRFWTMLWMGKLRGFHPHNSPTLQWPTCQIAKSDRWVCLKIVYPYTQWLMIIIPTKWLFHWEYTPFSDIPRQMNVKEQRSELESFGKHFT